MTLVAGVILADGIVMVSDGFALRSPANRGGQVMKVDTWSKIVPIGHAGVLIGCSGSALSRPKWLTSRSRPFRQPGKAVLQRVIGDFAASVARENAKHPGFPSVYIVACHDGEGPLLYSIDSKGNTKRIREYCAIGSGAGAASCWFMEHYRPGWTVSVAVRRCVDVCYYASRVPTVNFVPMIAVLTRDGARDFSGITKAEVARFKQDLRSTLAKAVASRPRWASISRRRMNGCIGASVSR